jgi:hypothetical protein
MPRVAPKFTIRLSVSEPVTRSDGTWIAAQFLWIGRAEITHEELENDLHPEMLRIEVALRLSDEFRRWSDPLPKIAHWQGMPEISNATDFITDTLIITYRAWGDFDLGDAQQTESLMKWVNADPPTGRPWIIDDNERPLGEHPLDDDLDYPVDGARPGT